MRLTLLSALVLAAGCARSLPPPAGPATASAGQGLEDASAPAPLAFQVKRYPGGEPYDIASDKGSVVLLDVWATWCEPCRDALPVYEQLAREYGPRGLKVYALSVDEDPRAIAPFLQETKVALPILVDVNAEVAERTLGVRMMPTTLLIDRRGVVRHVHEGFTELAVAQYPSQIEALLAERAP